MVGKPTYELQAVNTSREKLIRKIQIFFQTTYFQGFQVKIDERG